MLWKSNIGSNRINSMKIPTLLDISPTNLLDLDEKLAYQHFFGKSLDEARSLFGQGAIYVDDLGWMGEKAFNYYVCAYVEYLNSCDFRDLDINAMMSIVVQRSLVDKSFLNIKKLIDKISEFRGGSNRAIHGIERDYDKVVKEIFNGKRAID